MNTEAPIKLPLHLDGNQMMDDGGNTIAVFAEGWSDDEAIMEYALTAFNGYADAVAWRQNEFDSGDDSLFNVRRLRTALAAESKRLDWAIKNPYAFRAIYARFGNADGDLFRRMIDEEIQKMGQSGSFALPGEEKSS